MGKPTQRCPELAIVVASEDNLRFTREIEQSGDLSFIARLVDLAVNGSCPLREWAIATDVQ
jgi:hypothetical protein